MPDSSEESKLFGPVKRRPPCYWILAFALVTALILAPTSSAETASEYQIKAAYLYNFAKATQWPEEAIPGPDSALVIAVFGGDENFVKVLHNTLAGRTVTGHPIEIRHSRSLTELKSCQVVFFRASEKDSPPMIAALNSSGVLLVGEDPNFLAQGGMINLALKDGRVTFEVNPESIERAGVHYGQSIPTSPAKVAGSSVESAGSRAVKNEVSPIYPDIAKNLSLQGTVQLQAVVRADGTVREVHVVGGHPMLAAAAERAVMKWRYQPGEKETRETVRITFSAQ
jgi:TonB family protein